MVREVTRFDRLHGQVDILCGEIGYAKEVPSGCRKEYAEYSLHFTNYKTQWYCHSCAVELVPIW